eukprot:1159177-Pelagomonas_calceolata.AAC.5
MAHEAWPALPFTCRLNMHNRVSHTGRRGSQSLLGAVRTGGPGPLGLVDEQPERWTIAWSSLAAVDDGMDGFSASFKLSAHAKPLPGSYFHLQSWGCGAVLKLSAHTKPLPGS